MLYEIFKGNASYLLFCLNQYGIDGHRLTAKEQHDISPNQAIAWSGRKKVLVEYCKLNGFELVSNKIK